MLPLQPGDDSTMILRLTSKHRIWDIDEEHKRYKRYGIGIEPPEEWTPMSHFIIQQPRVSRRAFPGLFIREFTVFDEPDESERTKYQQSVALTWEEIAETEAHTE